MPSFESPVGPLREKYAYFSVRKIWEPKRKKKNKKKNAT